MADLYTGQTVPQGITFSRGATATAEGVNNAAKAGIVNNVQTSGGKAVKGSTLRGKDVTGQSVGQLTNPNEVSDVLKEASDFKALPNPFQNKTPNFEAAKMAADQSGIKAPDNQGDAASYVKQFSDQASQTPTFYKPNPNSEQIYNAQGQPVSFDQYKAQGGVGEMGQANWTDVKNGAIPQPQVQPQIDNFLQTNPTIQTSMQQLQEFLSPENTRKELADSMGQILKDKKVAAKLNLELMNVKRVMEGTDQDIRDEVEKAGGFATESQVQALTVGRNKTLLKRANVISDQLNYMSDVINTDMMMYGFQKDQAQQEFQQRSFLLNYKQQNDQFVYNATQNAINRNLDLIGPDGLYNATQGDPTKIARLEQVMGLQPGGLAQAAQQAAQQRIQKAQSDALDMRLKQAQISNIYSEIDNRNNPQNGLDAAGLLAYANQYASTGTIPTGLPKGTFGLVAQVAKESPKPDGTLVDKNTGVKPSGNDAKIAAYADMFSALSLAQQLKDLDSKRTRGLWGGLIGGTDSNNKRYLDLRTQITDLLARARTGAAMSANEEAFYSSMLPGRLSNPLGFGKNTQETIQNLVNNLSSDLQNKLNTQGYSIYGFSQVSMPDGNKYKVGDIVSNGTEQARVNADGSLTLIQ